jgi:hypothetical protein
VRSLAYQNGSPHFSTGRALPTSDMMSNGKIVKDASAALAFLAACCSIEPDLDQIMLPAAISMSVAITMMVFLPVFA